MEVTDALLAAELPAELELECDGPARFERSPMAICSVCCCVITVVCVESPSSHAFELQLSRKLSREKSVGYLHLHRRSQRLHRKMASRGPLVLGAALARLPGAAVHLVRRRAVSGAGECQLHDRQR